MGLKFRRGSTAQQSGSLAFGEPYVNTTLGTLVVGGATGDIVLSTSGTGSTGNFGAISGSGLDITGNANIAGNLTLGGAITIGDASADTVNVVASLSSSLIPQTDNVFDLGSATKSWRDLYISTGSIKVVANGAVVSTLSTNADGSQTFPNGLYSQANIQIGDGSYLNAGKFQVGRRGTSPDQNVVLGIDIMPSLTSGVGNVGLGRSSLYRLTTGNSNIGIGSGAGYGISGSNNNNIAIGYGTAFFMTGSNVDQNVFLGTNAGSYLNNGIYNTAIGGNALLGSLNSNNNPTKSTALGYSAGAYLTGNSTNNLLLGANAGPSSDTTESYKFYVSNGDTGQQAFMLGNMANDSRTLSINAATTISGSAIITNDLDLYGNNINLYHNGTTIISGSTIQFRYADFNLNGLRPPTLGQGLALDWRYGGVPTGSAGGASVDWVIGGTGVSNHTMLSGHPNGLNVNIAPQTGGTLYHDLLFPNNTGSDYPGYQYTFPSANGTIALTTDLSSGATSITALNSFSSSALGRLSNLESTSASLLIETANLETFSSSALTRLTALEVETSNLETFTASLSTTSNVRFGSLGIGMAASGTSGRIDAANDVVAFSTSDIRLKENIVPIPNALDKISKISGNTYDWRAELKDVHGYEGNDVGVIAQEVEAVLPQLVQDRDNGYKAVKYDKLVALLIEGIKEQQTQIHSLTLEIEKLKEQKGL
jgi:hypothetical protein